MAEEEKSGFWKTLGKAALNVALEVSPYILCGEIFHKVFYKHTTTDPFLLFKNEYFPDLISEKVTFPTSDKNTLTGYFYHYTDFKKDQVVIFAHGYGNGHKRYLDVINYLAQEGFLVFSYDMTSFDESEGKGIHSFPQGVIDLQNAISFVTRKSKYRGLPISLVGHSWGAYSVSTVLNVYPKVKKVVAMSGFNKSADIVRAHSEEWAGDKAPEVDPYIETYERHCYKNYANLTSLDGFKKSKAEIFIIHSDDDETVPIAAGLEMYLKEMKDNPRFKYTRFKNRGHGTVYYSKDGREYFKAFQREYNNAMKQIKNPTVEQREEYLKEHLDLRNFTHMLNTELMDEIVEFLKK